MRTFLAACVCLLACVSAPASHAQTQPVTAARQVALVRVYVTDFARSERFYRDVFGLTAPQDYGGRERVFTLDQNGARFVLALTPTARANGSFALVVTDIDAVFARAEAAGGAIVRAPGAPSGGVRIGFLTDPDGAEIEVLQPLAAPH